MRPPPPLLGSVEPVKVEAFDPRRVIFIGRGESAQCWYRCALPAMFMGADWAGVVGQPPELVVKTGLVRKGTMLPDWNDYDVVVIHQPRGAGWRGLIRRLQSHGKIVVFDVDDYLHGIRKLPRGEHDFAHAFGPKQLQEYEVAMRLCDAMICSTPYIEGRYRRMAKRSFVCRNGVDVGRYNLTLPLRDAVHIGWAGGTGHGRAMGAWLPEVARLLDSRPQTCFVSIGQGFAQHIARGSRTVAIPWAWIETYPAAMTNMDVALAPAINSGFYRGKSDLRWVEAGALGIPTIADPRVYPDIEPGVTGFWADTPQAAGEAMTALVDDEQLRRSVGAAAREYVREHRDMRACVYQWIEAIAELLNGEPSD